MCENISIVYNLPDPRKCLPGEEKAELGVLEEVDAIHQALVSLGYKVTLVSLLPPLNHAVKVIETLKTDLVFNLFEGFEGQPETEAKITEIIARTELLYTGCPCSSMTLALDKSMAKTLLRSFNIATPDWQVLSPDTLHLFRLDYPCIVKPSGEDASHGLSADSVVGDRNSLINVVTKISRLFGGQALVESFLPGREFNATVMGNDRLTVLPVSEIAYLVPAGMPEILTFSSKWEPESIYFECTKVICPADINAGLNQQITDMVLSAFRLLGCRGYTRFDIRLNGSGQPEIIEINPNPDISPESGAARQARAAGMAYNRFIEKIVLLALNRI